MKNSESKLFKWNDSFQKLPLFLPTLNFKVNVVLYQRSFDSWDASNSVFYYTTLFRSLLQLKWLYDLLEDLRVVYSSSYYRCLVSLQDKTLNKFKEVFEG